MTLVLAHRGSTDVARGVRENTVEAFLLAADRGADGVELDVRRTADGHLVVHHDALVPLGGGDRLAGVQVEVGPAAGGEVTGVRIETNDRQVMPPWLPSFEDILAACLSAGLFVNVEVKSEPVGPSRDPGEQCAVAAGEVCGAAGAGDRIVVSSFSIPALHAVRSAAARMGLAWLFEPRTPVPGAGGGAEPVSWRAIADGLAGRGGLASLSDIRLEGLHPYYWLAGPELVAGAHAAGLNVRTWTVDEPERIVANASDGVDAVITNDVTAALRALART
jgi:glycerophosphoryl diester phosphodiesterase